MKEKTDVLQLRVEHNLFERIKAKARKISFEENKDIKWQNLVRDVLNDSFISDAL